MFIKLGKVSEVEERDFINHFLNRISLGNRVSCCDETWYDWVNIMIYGTKYKILGNCERFRHVVFTKFIGILLDDDQVFVGIIMSDICNVCQLSSVLTDVELRNRVKNKIFEILKNDEQVCKKFIRSYHDLHFLSEFGSEFIKKILKLLFDRNFLVNFDLSIDKIYRQIEHFPLMTSFTILSISKNKDLIDSIFSSIEEVDKLHQHLITVARTKTNKTVSKLPNYLDKAFQDIRQMVIESKSNTNNSNN